MFNRSAKYIVLVIVNIVFLYVFLPEAPEFDDVVFDSTYVIDVLDNNRELERELQNLDQENTLYADSVDDLKRQTAQQDSMLKASREDLAYCQDQKESLIELSNKQSEERKKNQTAQQYTQQQCSDNLVKLEFVTAQVAENEELLKQLNTSNRELNSMLAEQDITISNLTRSATKYEANRAGLLEIIKTLQDDLAKPIYVKKLYVTPRYCDQPANAQLICLEKVLVMANFSKTTVSDVQVSLSDPSGRVLGEVSYNARDVRIVTFPFASRAQFSAGEFQLTFTVDGQVLQQNQVFSQNPT